MSKTEQKKKRTVHTGRVETVERLTPGMIRIVLGGEGLSAFDTRGHTDSYVKLLFPPPSETDPDSYDLDAVRAERPRSEWPVTRTYTVRTWDRVNRLLTLDFVYHGDKGLAGPWAAATRPGDRLRLLGPGGGYAPSPRRGLAPAGRGRKRSARDRRGLGTPPRGRPCARVHRNLGP